MRQRLFLGAALAVSCFASTSVWAQQTNATRVAPEREEYLSQHVPAPRRALELSVGTGYTQGFGMLQQGVGLPDVATPGLAVDVGVGARLAPRWSVGLTGQYQELNAERATAARGLTTGIAGTFHIAPYVRSDPWVQLGAGYRMLWERQLANSNVNLLSHGFELAKLTAGFDLWLNEDIAIAPIASADLNMFLWQDGGNNVAIANPRLSTFVMAGLQGRFDIAATHESQGGYVTTARR